jgi:short subunit fatty acids transporter
VVGAILWGVGLLVVLTAMLARERGVRVAPEVGKHLVAAAAIVVLSRFIGLLIQKGIR